jgi:hypothetical protein
MILLLLVPLIIAGCLSTAWSADVTPSPLPPGTLPPDNPQSPKSLPPSRIDPGIDRRPQTVPDPHSAVVPPKVDPKMAIDPETHPPDRENAKPGSSPAPPNTPPIR